MDPELRRYVERRAEALDRVRRMLVVCLRLHRPPEQIDPDASLFGAGLSIDSLDAVEIVVALEVEFGITLADPVERRLSFRSVNSLVDLVLQAQEVSLATG